ncbi:MAG: TIGR01777 family oxidoreductase [Armatimonadota bacterium]
MGKIIIAGGTGLIGSAVSAELRVRGHDVQLLSRTAGPNRIVWDGISVGPWVDSLRGAQTIINLAGSSISVKFTPENRENILESRTQPTAVIGQALAQIGETPHWINGSAIGFYGNRGGEICTEETPSGTGFLPETCVEWERQFLESPAYCPKSVVRIGVVLDHGGGAFPKLQTLTKAFLGGQVGDGEQYISWIHIKDLVALFCWLVENGQGGVFNGSAPNPVKNQEFMSELRKAENRPWSPPVPAALMRLIGATVGPDASLLLDSTRAVPKAALDLGFTFRYPTIREALQDLCTK